MSEQNAYDSLLQNDTAQRVRVSMMDAVDKQPDTEAKLQGLAKTYGMPVDAVRLRQPEIERQARLDALDYDTLANRYPKTANALANPNAAAIAHDDVDNMSGLERWAKYLFSHPDAKNTLMGDIGAGAYRASRGAAGVLQATTEAAAVPFDFLEQFTGMGGNPLRRLSEGFAMQGAQAKAGAEALSPAQKDVVGGGVSSGVQSFAQNVLALPLAFLPGGQPAALSMMSAQTGGQSYQDAREKGVDQWTALQFGASQAAIEYATEKMPLSKLIGDVKTGAPLIKSLMQNAALEIPGEQVATVLQDMNEWAVLHPEKAFSDYLAERPSAAAQTLIATLIGVGGNVTLTTALQKAADTAAGTQRTAQQAEARAQVLGELTKLAEASRVRERDPAQFAQFMQSVVEEGVPHLYVDANALAKSVDLNAVALALPSVAEQITQAMATGGDVVIPTQELLTAGAGNEFMQSLIDNARTAPEAMSPIEAREYMQTKGDQLKADIDKVLAEREQDQTWQKMRDDLRTEFKGQLDQAKRFTSDVNNQYATLLANFYSVTAAKLGISPQELAQRYGLQVQAKEVQGGQQLDQGEAQPRDLIVAHNLTMDNLRHANEIGGLPAPSLAITKAHAPLQGFGEITLLGDTKLASPSGKNPVFNADVYSPRFPDVKAKVDDRMVVRALEPLYGAAQDAGLYVKDPSMVVGEMSRNRIERAIGDVVHDTGMRYGYATEVLGKTIGVPTKEEQGRAAETGRGIVDVEPLASYLKTIDLGSTTDDDPNAGQIAHDLMKNAMLATFNLQVKKHGVTRAVFLANRLGKMWGTGGKTDIDLGDGNPADILQVPARMTDEGMYQLYKLTTRDLDPGTEAKQVADLEKLAALLDETIDNDEMAKWVREQLAPAMGERRIDKGDGKTAAYTLQNLVKHMTGKVRDAEGFNYGLGNARSKGATSFKTLGDVQAQRGQVQSKAEADAAIKENEDRFQDLITKVSAFNPQEQERYGRHTWELLPDVIGESYQQGMARALQANGFKNVPADLAAELEQFAKGLVALPTEYFEAKPQRAVGLNEFKGAAIPHNTPEDVRAMLVDMGLDLVEYQKGDEASRTQAVQQLAQSLDSRIGGVLFQQALPETIEIDGKQRPTTNSNGQPIAATEEGVRNFWVWFGDSKVVDASGKPLVVYHGTNTQFDAFDKEKLGAATFAASAGKGFFFAGNPETSAAYVEYGLQSEQAKAAIDAQREKLRDKYEREIANEEGYFSQADNAKEKKSIRKRINSLWSEWSKEDAKVLHPDEYSLADIKARNTGAHIISVYLAVRAPLVYDFNGSRYRDETYADVLDNAIAGSADGALLLNTYDGGPKDNIYVAFEPSQIKSAISTFDPANPSILRQQARGSITLPEDLTKAPAIISLFKGADLSTFIHESGHFFLEVQADLAARIQGQIDAGASVTDGEREIVADMDKLLAWFGVKGDMGLAALDIWHTMTLEEKRIHHEQFARGFEAYAFEGSAPSVELQGMFQKFRAWLVSVYKELKALNVTLTDDVRGVMDRMLASTEAIQEAEAARRMGPLFKTAEEAGMSLDEFAAYHALATDATQSAVNELQARGLRDMRWLANAKDKKLKELQAQYKTLRSGVRKEVRAEVMSQPVYRAWRFLTGKGDAQETAQPDAKAKSDPKALDVVEDSLFKAIAKLGGLSKDEAISLWGVDPKEKIESGVFGTPVLRKTGGLLVDDMAARLTEVGYLLPDENGTHDVNALFEAFDSERRGSPVYSTWHAYQRPEDGAPVEPLPEFINFGKLNTGTLAEQYGTKEGGPLAKLQALKMTSEARGIHPDVVAETFGFSSGDEMVRAILDAEPPASVIEGMTDQRMLERFGDLGTPEGLYKAADRAIHNEARARFVATEIRALETGMRVRAPGATGKSTVDVLATVARQQAEAIVARTKVRDLRPGRYTAAEARAARAAEKAMLAGKTEDALAEKRHQIINIQAAKATMNAQDEMDKTVKYLRKFDEKRPKGIDAEYMGQIDALLVRFDLAPASLKAIDKRKTLVEWVESQREQGMEPDIPPELLNEALRKSYKDMTVEELRGLRDTVRQIEKLGRNKNKLLTAKAAREFAEVRDEIHDSIVLHAGDRTANTRTPADALGRSLKVMRDFGAAHIKAATYARVMDGGLDGGPLWEYLIRTANDRGDMETTMRAEATQKLYEILQPVLKGGKMHGKGQYFAAIKRSMNREQVLAMALNMGNEANIQRMLGGEGWTIQQVMPVVQTLSASDWATVQAVWDHFESYRPLIGAKEKRIYGKEPEWVEAMPFAIQSSDGVTVSMRGGYYPIKYDPLASNRAEQHNDAEAAKRQLQGAYTSATTRRGFTKSRVAGVNGRPLLYSLQGVYSGVNDVIHDLAWHEWLIDANKILRSDKIDGAIREHYGPEVVRQFKTWVADVATGEQGLQAELDSALGRLRHGVSIAGLGFNVMSAAMQPLGLTQSIVRVGAKWVGRGMAQYVASPIAKTREVNGKSAFMANRSRTRFRELNELRNQVEGEHPIRTAIGGSAYFLMMRAQQMVDTPTWLGAYEKAISEGNTEDRAIALADQAVIDAQGGGQTKDLAAIERGGPAQKLFTVFYSFMNTALNAGVAKTMVADTPAKKAKLAADYLMLYTVPAVLGAILKDALTPGDSGDWDEWDKALKKLLAEQIGFLFGLMVVAREFGEAAKSTLGLVEHSRDYSGPAGTRLISDTYNLGKQVSQGELDDPFRKAAVNVVGDLFGLPAAQVNRTITGAEALSEGETQNPGALVFGYQKP